MARKKLIIMRGLPGSGKSTHAKDIALGAIRNGDQEVAICSTDSFFMIDGEYKFDADMLGKYHGANKYKVERHMYMQTAVIIVDNTNTTHKEMKPYKDLAVTHDYDVHEIFIGKELLFGSFDMNHHDYGDYIAKCHERGTHGVPMEVIERMARRFQE